MSRTIDITANTEAEAKSIANGELNENEAIIGAETISAPVRGIFGCIGKQEFKIRFTIDSKPEGKSVDELQENIKPREEKAAEGETANEGAYSDYSQGHRHDRNSRRPRGRDRGRDRDNHFRGRRSRNDNYSFNEEEIVVPERPKSEVPEEIKNHPQYAQIFEIIRDVAKNVGIESIETTDFYRDGAWVIEISGEMVSQLIGRRGKNLDALQYLVNIIFNKGQDERVKIVLDVQGYREKRYRNLILLANRMSRKVLNSHRQVELEPMSTLDRRTVHMALKDSTEVETFSKGTEPMRRVIISPIKANKKKNEQAAEEPIDFSDDVEETPASNSVPMFIEEDV